VRGRLQVVNGEFDRSPALSFFDGLDFFVAFSKAFLQPSLRPSLQFSEFWLAYPFGEFLKVTPPKLFIQQADRLASNCAGSGLALRLSAFDHWQIGIMWHARR
jgi:hypothetical protein